MHWAKGEGLSTVPSCPSPSSFLHSALPYPVLSFFLLHLSCKHTVLSVNVTQQQGFFLKVGWCHKPQNVCRLLVRPTRHGRGRRAAGACGEKGRGGSAAGHGRQAIETPVTFLLHHEG